MNGYFSSFTSFNKYTITVLKCIAANFGLLICCRIISKGRKLNVQRNEQIGACELVGIQHPLYQNDHYYICVNYNMVVKFGYS